MISDALVAVFWGIGNRLWGWGHAGGKTIGKYLGVALCGGSTAMRMLELSPGHAGATFFIVTVGMWAGRVSDGIRGTFLQKSIRGWKYLAIPLGLFLLTLNPCMLTAGVTFWQGGVIHWLAYRIFGDQDEAGNTVDYVRFAEPIDGWLRGFVTLVAIGLALQHPDSAGTYAELWQWLTGVACGSCW